MRIAALLIAAFSLSAARDAFAANCELVAIWREGRRDGSVCRAEAPARGLTVLDLGDAWLPPAFAASDTGDQPDYAATYLALAQERWVDAGPDRALAQSDRYFELYGIEPSLGVVHSRMADTSRHRCHDAIDDAQLTAAPTGISEEDRASALARIASARTLRAELDQARLRRHLSDLEALAARDPYFRHAIDRLKVLEARLATIRSVQAHLACDGLLAFPPLDGGYTWQTSNAVEAFQRGAMVLPNGKLDAATMEALQQTSQERDFRAALRVLRERVATTSGIIEDGSAGNAVSTVLGRMLDSERSWRLPDHPPLPDAAPDLISAATEAAARALGWSDPGATRVFLDAMSSPEARSQLVAVELPPLPAYHRDGFQLSVEIDRGGAWQAKSQRWRDTARRPALILYTGNGDHRVALVRWPTTVGGWQDAKADDEIVRRWKASPLGHRVWRDVFVGPRWLPPASTPDRELVRGVDGRHVLAREQLGPSYRAAFGIVAFVHLVETRERGRTVLEDQGIRTHGTGNLTSLTNGVSHGCHRLLGRNVLRLANFVLAHHDHEARGAAPTHYQRTVHDGFRFPVVIDSLGYRIELIPPISVDVIRGRGP